jgi:hypothetical protein
LIEVDNDPIKFGKSIWLVVIIFIFCVSVSCIIILNQPISQSPNDTELSIYKEGLIQRSFNYTLNGNDGIINVDLYTTVYNKLFKQSPLMCKRSIRDNSPCTKLEMQQYYLEYINDPIQSAYLKSFVNSIKSKTSDSDDQVRIAISVVQNIPYGTINASKANYPYEVLYNNIGMCEGKSLLLAHLIKELGYGVVIFDFKSENHMAIGIRSPDQYSYKNSGYAFIETDSPSIITDSQKDYVGFDKIKSNPQIFQVNVGKMFDSVSEDYNKFVVYNYTRNIVKFFTLTNILYNIKL